jgi:hypothetical protein
VCTDTFRDLTVDREVRRFARPDRFIVMNSEMACRRLTAFLVGLGCVASACGGGGEQAGDETLATSASALTFTQYSVHLDNGSVVRVDTTTGWTLNQVTTIILAADRSTQEDCPFTAPNQKGLFQTGDRLFLNSNYLAWFDYTRSDGNSAPASNWNRGGELAGVWSIDANTKLFRYYKTGSNGCSNWPRNELIPGSNSPNHEYRHWDAASPPIEHSLDLASGTFPLTYFSYHYGAMSPNGGFRIVTDGSFDASEQVHYKTSVKMANQWNKPLPPPMQGQKTVYMVDTTDGDDDNGISSFIQAELEYVMRPVDILSVWRFSPSNSIKTKNLLMGAWVAYAYNQNPACEADAGTQMPTQLFGQPLYVRSSQNLNTNWNGVRHGVGEIVKLSLGTECGVPKFNPDIVTDANPPVNAWIQWGESPSLATNLPITTFTIMGSAGTGTGTEPDPIRVGWQLLNYSTETYDGVVGGGAINRNQLTFNAGTWYQGKFSLRPGS